MLEFGNTLDNVIVRVLACGMFDAGRADLEATISQEVHDMNLVRRGSPLGAPTSNEPGANGSNGNKGLAAGKSTTDAARAGA